MTAPTRDELALRRQNMVDCQLRTCDVTDQALLAALLDTPREAFVAPAFASMAYLDSDAPALGPGGRRLLSPRTLARLIQAAEVKAGDSVLDVAGGSGYSAAILASLGAKVVALETDVGPAQSALAGRPGVEIVAGRLEDGVSARAPYDVILVNGAFEERPAALIAQLAEGGRLVGVDASAGAPKAVLIEKVEGAASARTLFNASAPVLAVFQRTKSFAF